MRLKKYELAANYGKSVDAMKYLTFIYGNYLKINGYVDVWARKIADNGSLDDLTQLGMIALGIYNDDYPDVDASGKTYEPIDISVDYNKQLFYNTQFRIEARSVLEKAAAGGNVRAVTALGRLFIKDSYSDMCSRRDAERYRKKGLDLIKKAAEIGDAVAEYYYGYYYAKDCYGFYCKEDDIKEEAKKWLLKSSEKGYRKANLELYHFYEGTPEADKYLEDAAELGDLNAMCNQAISYYNQQDKLGKEQAISKAVAMANKALAALGKLGIWCKETQIYWVARAFYLIDMYEQAFDLFNRSFNTRTNGASAHCIGLCYENGKGVAQDYQQAMKWYKIAVDEGSEYAQWCIGTLYDRGLGVEQNHERAVEWYKKAADNGYQKAIDYFKS